MSCRLKRCVRYLCILGYGALLATAMGCNPKPDSGVRIGPAGIRDFYTVRTTPDGRITDRDIAPTPRPREAITTDDYFALKIEHIFVGGAFERNPGNLAIIAEVGGIVPDNLQCETFSTEELGLQLSDQQESNEIASQQCRFKSVVQINPVFRDSHATFDSAFISPPFRTQNEPVRLQFIMAQLNDVEVARKIINWLQEKTDQAREMGIIKMNEWQSRILNLGFNAANAILDYASRPTYVFEMTTDFVPVETVEGEQPQSLLSGGDFVVVGMDGNAGAPAGALAAARDLMFSSGRLYWRGSREEYRETPYVVFKVIRYSRFPDQLPVHLATIHREARRGADVSELAAEARDALFELQDARIVNESEGNMLIDVVDWYAEARRVAALIEAPPERAADSPWADLGRSLAARVSVIEELSDAVTLVDRLGHRIYGNYSQFPGFRQDECTVIRDVVQGLADAYADRYERLEPALEELVLRRAALERMDARGPAEERELAALRRVEPEVYAMFDLMPERLREQRCPSMRALQTR